MKKVQKEITLEQIVKLLQGYHLVFIEQGLEVELLPPIDGVLITHKEMEIMRRMIKAEYPRARHNIEQFIFNIKNKEGN